MKKNFIVLFAAITLARCSGNNDSKTVDSLKAKTAEGEQTRELIKKFKPIIEGVWIYKDYVEKVIRTKSPIAAKNLSNGLTALSINIKQISGDSTLIGGGWGNHEGGDLPLKFRAGKRPNTILLAGQDLTYEIAGGDTILVLYQVDEKASAAKKRTFIKSINKAGDLQSGLDFLVNKGLISGIYRLIDSANTQQIVFDDDGRVVGLKSFTNYSINEDFVDGPMNNIDEIFFNVYKKDQTDYTFKINSDTLNIYSTKANADSSELSADKLVYKLVRTK